MLYLVVVFDAHAERIHENGDEYAVLKVFVVYESFCVAPDTTYIVWQKQRKDIF